jgi:uncharacterized coiled-coil protein SlyX
MPTSWCDRRIDELKAEVAQLYANAELNSRLVVTALELRDEARQENKRLRTLVETLLKEDPNELAADGGVTVLDVWRKEARQLLEREV